MTRDPRRRTSTRSSSDPWNAHNWSAPSAHGRTAMKPMSTFVRVVVPLAIGMMWTATSPPPAAAQEGAPRFSNSEMQVILDSLMHVALSSPDSDERMEAVLEIRSAGSLSRMSEDIEYTGVVRRLRTIYNQEPTPLLRDLIVRSLHYLDHVDEKRAFLRMVATETERVGSGTELYSLPQLAVDMLSHMGPEGRAVLKELDATDAVKNPRARAELQELKSNRWKPGGTPRF